MLNTLDGVRDETGASQTPWGRWTRQWVAEENRHGDLMNKYCWLRWGWQQGPAEKGRWGNWVWVWVWVLGIRGWPGCRQLGSLTGAGAGRDGCGVVWCGVVWCGVVWCGV